jgi:uncharacterized protein YaiI (UPF0178 family)
MTIYVDADACAVKEEIYRVALRTSTPVFVVANSFIRTPANKLIQAIVVEAGPDIADDWIAERAKPGDVVVTSDVPLADRALKAGAEALAQTGKPWTTSSIGQALASRAVMEHLRSMGDGQGGPKPFSAQDRQRFLNALDAALARAKKRA